MTPKRVAIVSSPAFLKLFEKARARMLNPKRKWCTKGRHKICPANAHVGDVLGKENKYTCWPCWRATNRKWYRSPRGREFLRKYNQAYRATPYGYACVKAQSQAYRAKQLGIAGRWTAEQFLKLCARYNNRCLCCGKRVLLTSDHVIPFALGGLNVIHNIQPLCNSCNCTKQTDTTDYRNNPHRNCRKRARPIKPKKIRIHIPLPEVKPAEDLFAGLF